MKDSFVLNHFFYVIDYVVTDELYIYFYCVPYVLIFKNIKKFNNFNLN